MKATLLALVVSLAIASSSFAGLGPLFEVNCSGSILTETKDSHNITHIKKEPLSIGRIFDEFGLSQKNYTLVIDTGFNALMFRPNSASSGLPTVTVIDFNYDTVGIKNQQTHKAVNNAAISSPATSTIFKDLDGSAVLNISYDKGNTAVKSGALVVIAEGSDPSGVGTMSSIQFKLHTRNLFVQQP